MLLCDVVDCRTTVVYYTFHGKNETNDPHAETDRGPLCLSTALRHLSTRQRLLVLGGECVVVQGRIAHRPSFAAAE